MLCAPSRRLEVQTDQEVRWHLAKDACRIPREGRVRAELRDGLHLASQRLLLHTGCVGFLLLFRASVRRDLFPRLLIAGCNQAVEHPLKLFTARDAQRVSLVCLALC